MTSPCVTDRFAPQEFDEPLSPAEQGVDGLPYIWDFSLLANDGDSISTYAVTMPPGLVDPPRVDVGLTSLTIWLKVDSASPTPAVPNQKLQISAVVTTNTGVQRELTGIVRIAHK